jgi:hypothetical protein
MLAFAQGSQQGRLPTCILSLHPYLINRPSQHLKLTITKTVCKGDCSLTKFVVLTCLASVRLSRL